jgi:hypothetical protein
MEEKKLKTAVLCTDCAAPLHYGAKIAGQPNFCKDCRHWRRLMDKMGVPEARQAATSTNARWFLRNGWVYSKNHPSFYDAQTLAKKVANRNDQTA